MGPEHRSQRRRRQGQIQAARGLDIEGRCGIAAERIDGRPDAPDQPLDLRAGDGGLLPGEPLAGHGHGERPVVQRERREEHLPRLQAGLERLQRLRLGPAQAVVVGEDAVEFGGDAGDLLIRSLDRRFRLGRLGLLAGGGQEAALPIQPLPLADLVLQGPDQRPRARIRRSGARRRQPAGDHDLGQIGHLQGTDGFIVAPDLERIVGHDSEGAAGQWSVADQVGLRAKRVEQLGLQGRGGRLGLGEPGRWPVGEADDPRIGHFRAHPAHAAGIHLGADHRDRRPRQLKGVRRAPGPGDRIGQRDPGPGQFRMIVAETGLVHDVDRTLTAREGGGVFAAVLRRVGHKA